MKQYVGPNGITYLITLIKDKLKTKVNTTDIVTNLTSTDNTKVLSASMGKELADRIANAGGGDMMASTYDINRNGVVDNAEKLDGKTYSDIETMAGDKATTAISNVKGQPSGLAPLDSTGKIDARYLPGYVDDVIEGYLHNGSFYKEETHTTVITSEKDKLYVDLATNKVYRWSGSAYIAVSGADDLIEMTNTDILQAWNTTFGTNE